jgi:hypothetical protein
VVYRTLADLLVVAHLAFVLFVVLGALLVRARTWVAWVHLPAAVWGVAVEINGWICPLTPLENHLRRMGGAAGYDGGFVERYLLPVLYPVGLTHNTQILLGAMVLLVNLVIYGWIWLRCRRQGGAPGPS